MNTHLQILDLFPYRGVASFTYVFMPQRMSMPVVLNRGALKSSRGAANF